MLLDLELKNSKLQEQLKMGFIVDPSLNDELSKLKEDKQEAVILISSLNDELSRVDQLSLWYESKIERLENEASSLNKEIACELALLVCLQTVRLVCLMKKLRSLKMKI